MATPSSANHTAAAQGPIIVTDTTCDLPSATVTEYGIHVVPHRITFGDKTYLSGVEINQAQVFEHLLKGELATTDAPTLEQFRAHYDMVIKEKRPVLSLHASRGLSETVTVAENASRSITDPPITVWDSRMVSAGLALLVLAAARASKAGWDAARILAMLNDEYKRTHFHFCADDLIYLFRGGRIGRVSYHVARTLGLRPIITISKEGETTGTYVSATDRPRSLKSAADTFVRMVGRETPARSKIRALVLYGDEKSQVLANGIVTQLKEEFDCVYIDTAPTTPVLGAHSGPHALGFGFMPGDWPV